MPKTKKKNQLDLRKFLGNYLKRIPRLRADADIKFVTNVFPLVGNQDIAAVSCGHCFHKKCLTDYCLTFKLVLHNKPVQCPRCRELITLNSGVRIDLRPNDCGVIQRDCNFIQYYFMTFAMMHRRRRNVAMCVIENAMALCDQYQFQLDTYINFNSFVWNNKNIITREYDGLRWRIPGNQQKLKTQIKTLNLSNMKDAAVFLLQLEKYGLLPDTLRCHIRRIRMNLNQLSKFQSFITALYRKLSNNHRNKIDVDHFRAIVIQIIAEALGIPIPFVAHEQPYKSIGQGHGDTISSHIQSNTEEMDSNIREVMNILNMIRTTKEEEDIVVEDTEEEVPLQDLQIRANHECSIPTTPKYEFLLRDSRNYTGRKTDFSHIQSNNFESRPGIQLYMIRELLDKLDEPTVIAKREEDILDLDKMDFHFQNLPANEESPSYNLFQDDNKDDQDADCTRHYTPFFPIPVETTSNERFKANTNMNSSKNSAFIEKAPPLNKMSQTSASDMMGTLKKPDVKVDVNNDYFQLFSASTTSKEDLAKPLSEITEFNKMVESKNTESKKSTENISSDKVKIDQSPSSQNQLLKYDSSLSHSHEILSSTTASKDDLEKLFSEIAEFNQKLCNSNTETMKSSEDSSFTKIENDPSASQIELFKHNSSPFHQSGGIASITKSKEDLNKLFVEINEFNKKLQNGTISNISETNIPPEEPLVRNSENIPSSIIVQVPSDHDLCPEVHSAADNEEDLNKLFAEITNFTKKLEVDYNSARSSSELKKLQIIEFEEDSSFTMNEKDPVLEMLFDDSFHTFEEIQPSSSKLSTEDELNDYNQKLEMNFYSEISDSRSMESVDKNDVSYQSDWLSYDEKPDTSFQLIPEHATFYSDPTNVESNPDVFLTPQILTPITINEPSLICIELPQPLCQISSTLIPIEGDLDKQDYRVMSPNSALMEVNDILDQSRSPTPWLRCISPPPPKATQNPQKS